MDKIRVLIADDDGQLSRRLGDFIADHGFEVKLASSGTAARDLMFEWRPRFVLADMMLPELNALDLLDLIKTHPQMQGAFTQLMVLSGHNSAANVRQAVGRGAKDYLVKPLKREDVLRRLVFHCRSFRLLPEIKGSDYPKVDEGSLMLHLTDLILKQANTKDLLPNRLFNLTRMVALKVDGVRCSIVHVSQPTIGHVVVSSDDKSATGIQLDLNKYPEIINVMNTGVLIAIEDLESSPELKSVRGQLKDVQFNSMIVCPVTRYQEPFGVLSLRMPPTKTRITDNEMRFVEIVAQVASLALSNENANDIEEFWLHVQRQPVVVPFTRSSSKPPKK